MMNDASTILLVQSNGTKHTTALEMRFWSDALVQKVITLIVTDRIVTAPIVTA